MILVCTGKILNHKEDVPMSTTTVSNTDTQTTANIFAENENAEDLFVISEKTVGQYGLDIECANNVLESLQDETELDSSNRYLLAEAKAYIEELEQQRDQLIQRLSTPAENFETYKQVA
jgi:hypothetical protein